MCPLNTEDFWRYAIVVLCWLNWLVLESELISARLSIILMCSLKGAMTPDQWPAWTMIWLTESLQVRNLVQLPAVWVVPYEWSPKIFYKPMAACFNITGVVLVVRWCCDIKLWTDRTYCQIICLRLCSQNCTKHLLFLFISLFLRRSSYFKNFIWIVTGLNWPWVRCYTFIDSTHIWIHKVWP